MVKAATTPVRRAQMNLVISLKRILMKTQILCSHSTSYVLPIDTNMEDNAIGNLCTIQSAALGWSGSPAQIMPSCPAPSEI
jgi:hypothetical protein